MGVGAARFVSAFAGLALVLSACAGSAPVAAPSSGAGALPQPQIPAASAAQPIEAGTAPRNEVTRPRTAQQLATATPAGSPTPIGTPAPGASPTLTPIIPTPLPSPTAFNTPTPVPTTAPVPTFGATTPTSIATTVRATSTPVTIPGTTPVGVTGAATTTATPAIDWRYIPDLTYEAIKTALERAGFRCGNLPPTVDGTWICRGFPTYGEAQQDVVIFGPDESRISAVHHIVYQHSYNAKDDRAVQQLTLTAGLPYRGANPTEAQEWMNGTIGRVANSANRASARTIGGATLFLYGAPTVRQLQLRPSGALATPTPTAGPTIAGTPAAAGTIK